MLTRLKLKLRDYLRFMDERPCRRGHQWELALGHGYICRVCGETQRGY